MACACWLLYACFTLCDPGRGSCNFILLLCVVCRAALCCMGEASRLCATQHSAPTSFTVAGGKVGDDYVRAAGPLLGMLCACPAAHTGTAGCDSNAGSVNVPCSALRHARSAVCIIGITIRSFYRQEFPD